MNGTPLEEERATRVDAGFKGFAPSTFGSTLAEIVAGQPSLFGGAFVPPIMVLRDEALRANIETMATYARDAGVELAPHGKTTLAPSIFRRQLEAGAWGISVATVSQVALCRAFGIRDILLANELVDRAGIAWVLDELARDADFTFLCYVDSTAGVDLLAAGSAARGASAPGGLGVLVEMGTVGGRTGCRTVEEAVAVAEAAFDAGLPVVGVAGYEGGLGHEIEPSVLATVRRFLEQMREVAAHLVGRGLLRDPSPILTAGGSVFFDEVVAAFRAPLPGGQPARTIIRAGAYVSHDAGHYADLSPFTRPGAEVPRRLEPALELWAQVVSRPETGLAITNVGRRDTSFDLGLPIPLRLRRSTANEWLDATGATVFDLNDQHAFVRIPAGLEVLVGDWMSFGISHPCTAFDKWHLLPVVDREHCVVDLVRTYF
ncbi:MAG: amino acid deaminase [Chloroflexota bacterium]|nr:MAG: amino acid deaminase [Chloroflexota bacterium]